MTIAVGDELPALEIEPITRKTLALFAGASGDHQPTHIDIDAAKAKGRDDVLAHGMLMMAYLGRVLLQWAPQASLRSYRARFVAMTPVHARPTCTGRVVAVGDGTATIALAATLADGRTVVQGEAVVDLRHASEAVPDPGPAPLVIGRQGSFAVGGMVTPADPDGNTLHADHADVAYQIPVAPRQLPLVFLHGNGQSTRTWETTPDGREGFRTIFLRHGFAVYLVDQPRRGRAGRSSVPGTIDVARDDQFWFDTFRVGNWPDYFPGVQFAPGADVLDQYLRQITPNTGPFDLDVAADAIVALFGRIGPGVLVTHSQGGGVGWAAAIKCAAIRAVVSYEPGSNFPFPHGEVPPPIDGGGGPLPATGVSEAEFLALTRRPILLVYGDNIPEQPVASAGQERWRVRLAMARLWTEAVNRRGGDVTLAELPKQGLHGNTHFPFSDLNNIEVADHLSRFLREKGLD